MPVIDIALDLIDDNPFNPRKYYPPTKVKEMAQSLREIGLRQVPEGRPVDGRVQLAYGHMRKKGFLSNQKNDPEHWKTMPLDVKDITDPDMFHFAIEENLRRTDITTIETARCIQAFSEMFPEVSEKTIGQKHSMTEANVSNMKRVLRLPDLFLGKIDEGLITFTQGRELLTLEGIPDAKELMSSALAGINTTGQKSYSQPNTVEGLQRSIHSVMEGNFPPLDKEHQGYRWQLLFDTRAAGCLECEKMLRTHPTKSGTAHFCTDTECWDRHDKEHRENAAAAAKAKMEAEVLERVKADAKAQPTPEPAAPADVPFEQRWEENEVAAKAKTSTDISQEKPEPEIPPFKLEKRGPSWIALDAQGVVIAIETGKAAAKAAAALYFAPVPTIINPGPTDYVLNHTYRFIEKPGSRKLECFDVTAQDLATAAAALEVDPENIDAVKAWKSSGKAGTSGSVSAGWSKCTEQLGKKVVDVAPADLIDEDLGRRIASTPAPPVQETPEEIPEEVLASARERAGTRAKVLDLKDICSGDQHWREANLGYAILDEEILYIDDPEECLLRCTHGFHFAFDSKAKEQKEIRVCSDTKCLGKKKSAFTRAKNAAGQGRKNAEKKALKEALAQTVTLDRPRIKLIILAQIAGSHASRNTFYRESGTKSPEKWFWDKLSAGTPDIDRTREKLFKITDKLPDEELARLVVEFMLYYLVDHGDIGTYKIKAEEPLKWLGIEIPEVSSNEEIKR